MTKVSRVKDISFREFKIVFGKSETTFLAKAYDKNSNLVDEATAATLEEVETEIKQKVLEKSHDFLNLNEALKLFRKHFPQDFGSPKYIEAERDYKLKAATQAQETLTASALKQWIDSKSTEPLVAALKKVMNSTNICSPFEKTRFSEFLLTEGSAVAFAQHLVKLLYGDNFDAAFGDFAEYLKTTNLRSWPIATYYPYLVKPQEHIFLKPEIYQRCAYRLGYNDSYESQVNPETYRAQYRMAHDLLSKLKPHGAKDMIDVQSFMYAIASDGYKEALQEAPAG